MAVAIRLAGESKMYKIFDADLSADHNDDYWSDYGMLDARNMLSSFSEVEWQRLKDELPQKSAAWLIRCAEVLNYLDNRFAYLVLVALLGSGNSDVEYAAKESLRWITTGCSEVKLDEKLHSEIKNSSLTAGPVGVEALKSLEKYWNLNFK
nr:hypothetical protein [uncultured Massilia sp.]